MKFVTNIQYYVLIHVKCTVLQGTLQRYCDRFLSSNVHTNIYWPVSLSTPSIQKFWVPIKEN